MMIGIFVLAKRKCGGFRKMNKQLKEFSQTNSFFYGDAGSGMADFIFLYSGCIGYFVSFVKTVHGHGTPIVTLEHYAYFIAPLFFWVIMRSLVLAFITALYLFTALPIRLHMCLAVKIERYKNIFLFFLILPFWTSLMVQVYSWFFVLEHNGLLNTIFMRIGLIQPPIHLLNTNFSIYLVMVYCYLPFMIMPLYTALEKIDRRMFEAAADLGASQWQALASYDSFIDARN